MERTITWKGKKWKKKGKGQKERETGKGSRRQRTVKGTENGSNGNGKGVIREKKK